MTAATCPHCGSPIWIQYGTEHDPLGINTTYECGDSVRVRGGQAFAMDGSASFPHGPACRMIRALRISQLKRMAHTAWLRESHDANRLRFAKRRRYQRFASSCYRELDRLRGQQ